MDIDWSVKIVEGVLYLALASVIMATFFRLNKHIKRLERELNKLVQEKQAGPTPER